MLNTHRPNKHEASNKSSIIQAWRGHTRTIAHIPYLPVISVPQCWLNSQCDLLPGQICGIVHSCMSISSLYCPRKLYTQLLYSRQKRSTKTQWTWNVLGSNMTCIRERLFITNTDYFYIYRSDNWYAELLFNVLLLFLLNFIFISQKKIFFPSLNRSSNSDNIIIIGKIN